MQPQASQHGFQKRVAQPGGRAKKLRPSARNPLDSVLRPLDLSRNPPRTQHRKPMQVMLTMILDRVTPSYDFPSQLRMLLNQIADAEKGGPDLKLIQHLQHVWRN